VNVTIERKSLLDLLGKASQAAARKPLQPVLGMVLLDATPEGLAVRASDTETGYSGVGEVSQTKTQGAVLVEAAKILASVRALPAGPVQLKTENNRLVLRSGRAAFRLPWVSLDDHPGWMPEISNGLHLSCASGDLRAALSQVSFCVSPDDARYGLNGLNAEYSGDVLRLVATDGTRLALAEIEAKGDAEIPERTLIPRTACDALRRVLPDTEDEVTIAFGDGLMQVELDSEVWTFRLIDGEFPDYRLVMPESTATNAVVSVDALKQACLRAKVAQGHTSRATRVEWTATTAEIIADANEHGSCSETIEVETTGPGLVIGLNGGYVLEALGAIPGPTVEIGMNAPLQPVTIKDPTCPDSLWIVMPMRVD